MKRHEAPFLPLSAAFALGIVAAPWAAAAPGRLLVAGGLLLGLGACAAALGRYRPCEGAATVALLAVTFVLGALRGATEPLPADHIARAELAPLVRIEGRLADEPIRWAPDRTRLSLDVDGYFDKNDRRPASGRLQVTLYGETAPVGEGQRVSVELKLSRPRGFRNPGGFDYPAFLRREGILLVGSGRAETLAALLAGLILGEKKGLPPESDEAFRRAGVYHILAVSGFNVALLASSVFFVLSALGISRRATAVTAGAALVGFALVVGGQASVLRATVMGLLLLAALLLDRKSQLMNALALAALALLTWRPGDLWDPGFQLSFAATAGIIYLTPAITAWLAARGWPAWLATAVAVSVGAQAAVTPVMLIHFNQLSLIGIAANLIVVPLAAVATTLGMLALLVALASAVAADVIFP